MWLVWTILTLGSGGFAYFGVGGVSQRAESGLRSPGWWW